MPLACDQLLILFHLVKFSLMNTTHLEEQTASGGDLASDDMSVSNEGQVLLLGICRYAKLASQLGVDLSVKLVGDQGDTHSSFERLAAVVARPVHRIRLLRYIVHSVTKPKLNHANMQSKLSSVSTS